MLYTVLCELLGDDRVDRQVIMNGWPIDVVIKNDDQVTYVQYDGVYWHGLDRPLEEIALHKKPRDVVIQQKWSIDRRQDVWFVEQGLKLVRVTDAEFKRDPAACVRRIVDA
jgi:very-short-patch-repair endonuclease